MILLSFYILKLFESLTNNDLLQAEFKYYLILEAPKEIE